jgi:hypothetical protein
VQRGESLVVCSELVDLASDAQLWSQRYNRELSEIFAVQEEIAAQVSEALRLQLTGEERQNLSGQHTQSREAYLLYLKGRFYEKVINVKADVAALLNLFSGVSMMVVR